MQNFALRDLQVCRIQSLLAVIVKLAVGWFWAVAGVRQAS